MLLTYSFEFTRCVHRAIYELAVTQTDLDMPEVLWKAYIDFEVAEGELDNARSLYERLLFRSAHVKVWIAYAQFELESGGGGGGDGAEAATGGNIAAARALFNKGYEALKSQGLKEERLLLLEAWRDAESAALASADANSSSNISSSEASSREHLTAVEAKFPRKIKMRRPVMAEDGVTELGTEEYFDYVFPDDEKKMGTCSFCVHYVLRPGWISWSALRANCRADKDSYISK